MATGHYQGRRNPGGIVVGVVLASRLQEQVSPLFSNFIDSENGARIASFIAIFAIVMFAAAVAIRFIRTVFRMLLLGWMDYAAGLGLGVLVMAAILSAMFAAIQSDPILVLQDTIDDSVLGAFLTDNFDELFRVLKLVPRDFGI